MSTPPSDETIDVDIPDAPAAPFPRASAAAAILNDENEDDDPITASYPVFLNPALPLGRRLLVLQHPNRTDEGGASRAPPSELRLKAESGMVEVDMPLDYNEAYDRDKGLRWGRTLQASMAAKNGGSHGLAGGFGFGAVQQRGGGGGGRKRNEVDAEDLIDWNEAVRQDKVLRTQTLGGQYPDADEVQYMVGVFQGNDLHLTPVSSLVHLRPQLHHLDAATQQERQAAAKDAAAAAGGASGAGGPGGPAARAIHMSIKTTADGESVTTETIADRLRAVQGEPWRKMRYTDENEEAAWEVYNESLFLSGSSEAKGGKKTTSAEEEEEEEEGGGAGAASIEGAVATFASKWETGQLLEAVSGIKKPERPLAVTAAAASKASKAAEDRAKQEAREKKTAEAQAAAAAAAAASKAEEETRRPKRAPRGGGGLGTAKRTSRAK